MPARLEQHGIVNVDKVFWNLPTPALYEEAIRRKEGVVAHLGPLVVRTGHYTGRSPDDRFIVREPSSEDKIWWSKVNIPIAPERFDGLFARLVAYLQGRDVFVQDCYAGADRRYRVPLRVISEHAWHSLFARNMFIQVREQEELDAHVPRFTILHTPHFHALPDLDGVRSEAFIILHFGKGQVIIGGTSYGGEIKKSVFTVLNYLLPQERVLSMHCSCNVGRAGDVALFFGLSGTGKTSLSADPDRRLVGDDEHGWSDEGVFNFEGGCYAKVIRLSREAEPEIYECTRRFGTILENVRVNMRTRRLDLDDASLTENTRAAYPIAHIPGALREGIVGHPQNIVMLTCDAFGIMAPVARMRPEQAIYHFLSGYTAKVAGTERGILEPQATFSACFGAPFMALPPTFYARMLGDKIRKHDVKCWLVNTGWTGGPYGEGQRIKIAYTRAMVAAALSGKLDDVPARKGRVFGLDIPLACEGVPSELLDPRTTWRDPDAYDAKARELAAAFRENFTQFAQDVDPAVIEAEPKAN